MDDSSRRLPDSGEPNAVPPAPVPGDVVSDRLETRPAQNELSAAFPPMPERMLDEYDLGMPRRRRGLPLVLFLATCFFTYAAGTYHWRPVAFGMQIDQQRGEYWDLAGTLRQLAANWADGLMYSACVMAILMAHEMGHFVMTVRHRVPASYPIFIPMPMMVMGTMGAVIGMEGFRANRRQMFDIGLAGPLAGLVLTIPMVWIGIKTAQHVVPQQGQPAFGDPLLAKLLIGWLRPDLPAGHELVVNPVYMAGWVGMFVTGLNMLPVSQLDGGHVIYALFLNAGRWMARIFLLSAIAFVVLTQQYSWTLMIVIVTLIGVDHPPTADDSVPLGWWRTALGIASLAIPVLCFTPFLLYLE
jgi:membrane-associated protease RseP (regulator of RpoE activity)